MHSLLPRMSLNWSSTIALLVGVLVRPRLLVPHVSIRDIRQLDYDALRRAGYVGAVFDKDNCLTLPLQDTLIPELSDAWSACKTAFGPSRVLVVSNSAGTVDDPAGIQAESVSYNLGVPVLTHASKKPGWSCVRDVQTYFSAQLPAAEDSARKLLVVGDRLFTDVVLSHRLASPRTAVPFQTLAVLVEPWDKADARVLRVAENTALRLARRVTGLHDATLPDASETGGIRVLEGRSDILSLLVSERATLDAPQEVNVREGKNRASEWEGK